MVTVNLSLMPINFDLQKETDASKTTNFHQSFSSTDRSTAFRQISLQSSGKCFFHEPQFNSDLVNP